MPPDGIQRTIFLTEIGSDFEKASKKKKVTSKVAATPLISLKAASIFIFQSSRGIIFAGQASQVWVIYPYKSSDIYKVTCKTLRELPGPLRNLT